MIISNIIKRNSLLFKGQASVYIYLRDHNKHINPRTSILNVTYRNPANLVPDAPSHSFLEYQLPNELQTLLDRQVFEEYKTKILRGIIDKEKTIEADPLWGEEPAPVHYFNRISKIDLMRVSHPQNNDAEAMLQSAFESLFQATSQPEITYELIKSSDVHALVQLSVAARQQEVANGEIWFQLEEGFKRGKSLYLLSSEELVKLKWAFDHKIKQGTPVFHEILACLLREDLPTMKKQLLFSLFFACRYSNSGQNNLQNEIIETMKPLFKGFTLQEKSNLLLAFSLCTKPIKQEKKVHKRRRNEFKDSSAALILQLDLWNLPLTNETTAELVFALAKLQIENTKFITFPLRDHISENLESYCQDNSRLFQAIVYLDQLEASEGVMDQELAGRLRQVAELKWDQFTPIQQMRMVHALWNLGLMDEALLEQYKAIEFESDTSLLYYACQIQLNNSSEREWQIVQCLAHIDTLPLPYFTAFKRFYNYMKATTEWDLTPLADKLKNLEYYHSAMRQFDTMNRTRSYRKLRQFEDFTGATFTQKRSPIDNLEFAHFGFPLHKASLDIVDRKEFIPGTTQLKESYMNKVRSLKNIGWKHLAFTKEQLQSQSLADNITNIQECFLPYIEEQQAIIDYEDYLLGNKIEAHKQIEEMKNWELSDINQYMSQVTGEDYIELGEEIMDEMSKGLNEIDQGDQKPEAAAKKKKKK